MKKWIIILIMLSTNGLLAQTPSGKQRISDDLELVQISEHAYVHVSRVEIEGYGRVSCNGLIFVNKGKCFLLDTPATDLLTRDLVNFLKDSLHLQLTGFVPNHWHSDCMGGLGYLQSQHIQSWANQITIDLARTHSLPAPAHGFRDSLRLSLGGKQLDCYYFGPAHSMDNIVVWIPSERILFAGCMVKSLASADLGNTADGDLASYPKTIGQLLKRFQLAKIVIPGHGDFGGIELIRHTMELAGKHN